MSTRAVCKYARKALSEDAAQDGKKENSLNLCKNETVKGTFPHSPVNGCYVQCINDNNYILLRETLKALGEYF